MSDKTIVKVEKLRDSAIIPTAGSEKAAGMDLYVPAHAGIKEIEPGETEMIGTGLAMEIPDGYFGAVFARSGLAAKEGLRPANCVGVVDSDYRGEVKVALHNDSKEKRLVKEGERIAQLVLMPYLPFEFEPVSKLTKTERGEGGFGSTGKA